VIFDGCVFEGNYAVDNGGDAAGRGGAIFHECEANIVLLNSTLTGNYSENNGGAIAVMGWDDLQIFQTEFVGNYAKSGGAIYTEGASDKFANLYIDECSFDGHYITATYGTTMNINGIGVFCMNNTSIRNSYNTSKQKADKASWVAMDVVQEYTSISNCSIIGNTQYGSDASSLTTMSDAGLIALWGNNHYFTNNIIVPESDAVVSILGGGSDKIDLSYNHYNTVSGVEATDNGGNTTENTAANFGSLAWTDGCWMWNGQIGGAAPEMMTQEAVLARFNSVCPAFVEWCGEDFYKDQLGVVRTGAWWPGAYQKN
jgi:predicted outer membrane repeat protein